MNKKDKYGGLYTSERDAAHSVNKLCDENGLDRKNPQLGDPPGQEKGCAGKEHIAQGAPFEKEQKMKVRKISTYRKLFIEY